MKPSRWMSATLIPFLLTLLLSSVASGTDCETAADHLTQAENATEASLRTSLLERAFSLCPEETEIGRQLALALLEAKRFSEARDVLESLISRSPELPVVLLAFTDVAIAEGDYQRAIRLYQAVLEFDPEEPRAMEILEAWAAFRPFTFSRAGGEGDSLQAFFEGREARRVLERSPEDPEARRKWATYLLHRGRRLLSEEKNQEAEESWRRAVSLDPDFEGPRRALANLYQDGADFDFGGEKYNVALEGYLTALRWLPENVSLHIRVGKTYERMRGRESQALQAYQRASELLAARTSEGSIAQRREWAEAVEAGFVQVDAKHPAYRRREAVRQVSAAGRAIQEGRSQEGAEAYLRAIHWTPEDPLIHYELANVYRTLEGAWQEGVRHYGLAIELFEENPPNLDPAQVRLYTQRAERERASLERAHTGTLAYFQAKFSSAFSERRFELALFSLVFAAVIFFLWRA